MDIISLTLWMIWEQLYIKVGRQRMINKHEKVLIFGVSEEKV